MTVKTYNIRFKGYWREANINSLPSCSGIYGVYTCFHNLDNTVSLSNLIYIGESNNVKGRIIGHEKRSEWLNYRWLTNVEICFNVASISPGAARRCVEAAMIYAHKPPCNTEYKYDFPFDATTVKTSGMNALMMSHFIARTASHGWSRF